MMRADIAKAIVRVILQVTRRWWRPIVERHILAVLDRAVTAGIITKNQKSELIGVAARHPVEH
jgi:hypothetical protein